MLPIILDIRKNINKETKINLERSVLTEDLTKLITLDLKEVYRVGCVKRVENKIEIKTKTEMKLYSIVKGVNHN